MEKRFGRLLCSENWRADNTTPAACQTRLTFSDPLDLRLAFPDAQISACPGESGSIFRVAQLDDASIQHNPGFLHER
jgi:hypothetical protein